MDALPNVDEFSDAGIALRLASRSTHLRHVPAWGWMAYADGVWRRGAEAGAMQQVIRLGTELSQEAAEASATGDKGRVKELNQAAGKCFSDYGIRAVLNVARSLDGITAVTSDFDRDPWLLNVRNGTLDLQTGRLRPHDPADLLARQASVHFEYAEAPRWTRFLDEVFLGDRDLVRFVQRAAGYSLTGDTREQVWFLCLGDGANGKSTMLEALRGVLGDYAHALNADALMRPAHGRDASAPDPELAGLVGVRLVTAVEPSEGAALDVARLKQLTGGDTISTRHLYKEVFEYRPAFKLWLAANGEPGVSEQSTAMWRRIRKVPYRASFRTHPERDLPATLAGEASGILKWLVDGCLLWQRPDGLGTCATVEAATRAYQQAQDPYFGFFEDVLVREGGHNVLGTRALDAFTDWCSIERIAPLGRNAFYAECERRGLYTRHVTRGMLLLGCRLEAEAVAA